MADTDKKTDDQKFNDTLKRMLEMPPNPKPHKDGGTQRKSTKSPPPPPPDSTGDT